MFEQAIYRTASSRRVSNGCPGGSSGDVEGGNQGEQATPRLDGASTEILDTMKAKLIEYSSHFERLEDVAER